MLWGWLLACRDPVGPPLDGPRLLDGPFLTEAPEAPLARRLQLSLDRPALLVAEVDTDAGTRVIAFRHVADTFDVPILGVPAEETATVRLSAINPATGAATELDPLTFTNGPLPASFPVIDALAVDPERSEPGYWLVSLGVPSGPFWLAVLDPVDLSVVWLYTGPIDWGDVRPTGRGTLIGLWGGVHEVDMLGSVVRRWLHPSLSISPDDIPLPWLGMHHELFLRADGTMMSLTAGTATSPAYPTSYDPPTPGPPASISDDHVVWFDAAGAVLGDLPLSTRLDTSRIGFGSLNGTPLGYDWVHANAVVADPAGGFLASSRHQGTLAKLDDRGEIEWILADPSGWSEAFAPLLLRPEGEPFVWPQHQHGPDIDPEGRIAVFDNRMFTHTPYTPEPDEVPASRVVAFRVDAAARTVRQEWSWSPPDGPLLSNALGNADWLPITGHVLADFGFLDGEPDADNATAGRGRKHARLMEIDPEQADPVVDARLWVDADIEPEGVKVYRAIGMPSLYGDLADESVP